MYLTFQYSILSFVKFGTGRKKQELILYSDLISRNVLEDNSGKLTILGFYHTLNAEAQAQNAEIHANFFPKLKYFLKLKYCNKIFSKTQKSHEIFSK